MVALTRQSVNRHLFNILLVEAKSTSRSTSSSLQCDATPVVMGSEEENAVPNQHASGKRKLGKYVPASAFESNTSH